jgi:hypothetical protein
LISMCLLPRTMHEQIENNPVHAHSVKDELA